MKTRTRKPGATRSLTATLIIAFLALSLVTLFVSSGLQIVSSLATQQEAVARNLQLTAQDAAKTVNSFIQDKFSLLTTAVQLTSLTSAPPAEQRQILEKMLGRDLAFRQLAVLDPQDQEQIQVSRLSQATAPHLTDQLMSGALPEIKQGNNYVGPIYIDATTSEPLVIIGIPMINVFGDFQGTLLAEVNLKSMWDVVDHIQVGETGVAYVVDKMGHLLASRDRARVLRGENVAKLVEVRKFIVGPWSVPTSFLDLSIGLQGTSVASAHTSLDTTDWAVVVELPWDEAYREVIRNFVAAVAILLIMAVLAGLVGVYVARRLAVPLVGLTNTATRIAAGELELQAAAGGPREVGALAHAFNSMTAQLRDLVDSLETRVELRTAQLQASADVARAAASILDPDRLLHEIVNLITDRFGFYYTAVFMPDETGQWLVLREATGEAGRILKDRGHKLAMDEPSMSGYVFKQRKPRIALDVGTEAVRFANPLLPETRSEIALPLIVGDRVLGSLDVQSTQAAAFDEASAAVLQSMADQIAIALSNTQQFRQTEATLMQSQTLYNATQAITAARDNQSILQALLLHAAHDADRATLVYYGPPDATGQPAYYESVATWAKDAEDLPIAAGTHYTLEQLPILGRLTPAAPVILHDDPASPSEPDDLRAMHLLKVKTAVGIVLTVGQIPFGALVIGYRNLHRLSPDELQTLLTLTSQAAIAIQNQRSLAETQVTLQQMAAINRRLTGQAWQAYSKAVGAVHAVDAAPGVPTDVSEAASTLSRTIALRGEVLGELSLQQIDRDRIWTADDVTLLQAVANEVAVAVENVRLIEETENRARREARLNRIAQQLQQTTDIDSILRTAAQELSLALDTSHARAQLGKPQAMIQRRNGATDDTVRGHRHENK